MDLDSLDKEQMRDATRLLKPEITDIEFETTWFNYYLNQIRSKALAFNE